MTDAISLLVASSMTCTACGTKGPPGTCSCWITQECTQCGMSVTGRRADCEPAEAILIETLCLNCDPAQKGVAVYRDRAGNEVLL